MQTAFVPETHAGCWPVLVVASCRIVERMAERSCVVVQLDVKKGVRSRGSSSGLQGNEITKRESFLDGTDCCDLEWKLHESTVGNSLVEQSCGSDVGGGHCEVERCWSECWCTSEDGRQKHHGGRAGCVVGGSLGVCGIEGVS